MTNIERTLKALLTSILKDRTEINAEEVYKAWKEYSGFWHDLSSAMNNFESNLLRISMERYAGECVIQFGQYMENFKWSLQKYSNN